ncbi:sodium-dependent phosphate transport protein 1 isoform X2 [Nilaparvata lugens]|nr:sodium-dependent phosphate transport protein 1 isoform X2 [Nilaparvata lugens]
MVFTGMCLHGIIQMDLVVENALIFGKDCAGGALNSENEGYIYLFYLSHTLPQAFFGRASDVFGGRKIFGFSILIVSCILLIFPAAIASGIGSIEIDALRLLMCILLAPVRTAIINIMTKWVPPNERGRFSSNLFANNFGSAIFMLIPTRDVSQYGVGILCYTSALFGFIWSVVWFTSVSDSPIDHPRISAKEKTYILKSTTRSGTIYGSVSPQWIDMLCSKQVWVIITTDSFLLLAYYFTSEPAVVMMIESANAQSSCWLYSTGAISTFIVALVSGIVCDYLLSRKKMNVITARKTFTCIAAFGTAIAHSAIVLTRKEYGYQHTLLFMITTGFVGASCCGLELAFNDFAPNFAATLFGITEFISGLIAVLIKKIISEMDFKNGLPLDELLCLAISFFLSSGVLYLIFGRSDLVRWNQHYIPPRSVMRDNRSKYIIFKRDVNYI